MGVGFSATTLKVKLKMATQRIQMQLNKTNNMIRVDMKTVSKLLSEKKDESARIKVEGIIRQKYLVNVYETISLMCDLLATRIQIISNAKEVPGDMEESMASLIYCSGRVEIPELNEIAHQFGSKFGEKWARGHLSNSAQRVNPRIVDKLSITPPDFTIVLKEMKSIASEFNVEWEPDFENYDKDDAYALGSVAAINKKEEKVNNNNDNNNNTENQSSGQNTNNNTAMRTNNNQNNNVPITNNNNSNINNNMNNSNNVNSNNLSNAPIILSLYPGTLNLMFHQLRDLSLNAGTRIHIRVFSETVNNSWFSEVVESNPPGSNNFIFSPDHHIPIPARDSVDKLSFSLLNFSNKNEIIGEVIIPLDHLRQQTINGPVWYPLVNSKGCQCGSMLLSSSYNPLKVHPSSLVNSLNHPVPEVHQSLDAPPPYKQLNHSNSQGEPGTTPPNSNTLPSGGQDEFEARFNKLNRNP